MDAWRKAGSNGKNEAVHGCAHSGKALWNGSFPSLTFNTLYFREPLEQKLWRSKRAWRRLDMLVRNVYIKVKDPPTGAYYYYNLRTGVSTWEKPRLLVGDLEETHFEEGAVNYEAENTSEGGGPVEGGEGVNEANDKE